MATRLVVLDPDSDLLELFRRVGDAAGCEVITETSPQASSPASLEGDLAAIAPGAFSSLEACCTYIEASAPDSVLLLVQEEAELEALSERERCRLAGIALKPLSPALAAAHLEAAARRCQERRRREATLRAVPDMVFRLSREARYLECYSPEDDRLYVEPQDFLGRHVREIMPADVAERTEHHIELTLSTGSRQAFEYEIQHPGSLTRSYEARLAVSGPDEVVAIVRDITDIRRAETELLRAAETRKALASRILHLQESERHQLARELHDAVGQMLLVHKLDAEWLRTRATSAEVQKSARALAHGLEETLATVRSLARGIRPPALDDLGLGAALEVLASEIASHASCQVIPDLRISGSQVTPEAAITLYRIAQEALTNAIRHARCTNIWIALDRGTEGAIELRVDDDGAGISESATHSGRSLGLAGMRERAALHGGHVSIRARSGGGTSLVARLPRTTAEGAFA